MQRTHMGMGRTSKLHTDSGPARKLLFFNHINVKYNKMMLKEITLFENLLYMCFPITRFDYLLPLPVPLSQSHHELAFYYSSFIICACICKLLIYYLASCVLLCKWNHTVKLCFAALYHFTLLVHVVHS